jgi:ribosomal-protein-alanine N-acetyltransferase
MHNQSILQTKRLLLRQWTDEDFLPFAKMCADKDVMEFFPKVLTESESNDIAKEIKSLISNRGWGFWAVEIPNHERFIGFVGLHTPDNLPFSPCVEIGWRLSKTHWRKGYATEAASKCLKYAFTVLNLKEVVSFTTVANNRSQAVMQKIGMSNTGCNFMHPEVAASHPQCEHVLYKIQKQDWTKSTL